MQTGIERLRTLYSVLAGIPAHVIDLESWRDIGAGLGIVVGDEWLFSEAQQDGTCGTTACSVGWACAYPAFKAEGLYFGVSKDKHYDDYPLPRFLGFRGWDAVTELFGLRLQEADAIFGMSSVRPSAYMDADAREHLDAELAPEERDDYSAAEMFGHKQLALMRIRNYLFQRGAITAERSAQLKACETVDDWSNA